MGKKITPPLTLEKKLQIQHKILITITLVDVTGVISCQKHFWVGYTSMCVRVAGEFEKNVFYII